MVETITVGLISEFETGKIHKIEHGEQVIALVNVDNTFYAMDGVCSHAGGPLCRGEVIEEEMAISCPWHGWEYDLKSGECLMDPSLIQKTFTVSIIQDEVQITLE